MNTEDRETLDRGMALLPFAEIEVLSEVLEMLREADLRRWQARMEEAHASGVREGLEKAAGICDEHIKDAKKIETYYQYVIGVEEQWETAGMVLAQVRAAIRAALDESESGEGGT